MDKKQAQKALDRILRAMKSTGAKIGFADEVDFDYGKSSTPFPSVNGMTNGGLPKGKLTVVSGPPGSCKTTLVAQSLAYAQAQDPDLIALWVDVEHCWDTTWMTTLGVDVDRVIVAKMLEDLEETLDLVIGMCREKAVGWIVYDSVGAISPRGEFESKKGVARDMHEDTVGLTARQFNKFLRIITPKVARAECVIVLIAQVYSTIGIYSIEQVKGGKGIGHHAHLRLIMRRMKDESKKASIKMPGSDQKSTVLLGWNVNVKVDKSKQSSTEGYSVVLPFTLGIGIVAAEAAIITAIQIDLIKQKGAWFVWGEQRFHGKQQIMDYFMANDEEYGALTDMMKDIAAEDMIRKITTGSFSAESDVDEIEENLLEEEAL